MATPRPDRPPLTAPGIGPDTGSERHGGRGPGVAAPQIKHGGLLLVGALLFLLVHFDSINARLAGMPSPYSFAFVVLLFLVPLPGRLMALSLPLALGVLWGLRRLSEAKVAATGLPLTYFDLRMAVVDSSAIANAIGWGSDAWIRCVTVLGLVLCVATWSMVRRWLDRSGSPRTMNGLRACGLMIPLLGVLGVCFLAAGTLSRYGRFVHGELERLHPDLWPGLWTTANQAALARRLGTVEYIAFTRAAGDGDAQLGSDNSPPPPDIVVRETAAEFVRLPDGVRRPLPNIVYFHAESTFNPNDIFRVDTESKLPLWSRGPRTQALGPLRVNVIGGGSWVTEFEVLTGVDSRFFGYHGYFAHSYLAPLVRSSLPRYLVAKGYRTAAYYSAEGGFFDVERAFMSYGFQEFIDAPALGLGADWTALNDMRIAEAITRYGAFGRTAPFFYFISTAENHGPHPCRNFASAEEFSIRFAGDADFAQNCALNEYLKRARSTSDALDLVLAELERLERSTGRPFVLLVYGDHQPWSFTDGLYSVAGAVVADRGIADLSRFRSVADGYRTFFHLLASAPPVLAGSLEETPPPATLLPTLVSAFAASSLSDLYQPLNFLQYRRCGSDSWQPDCELYPDVGRWMRAALSAESADKPGSP